MAFLWLLSAIQVLKRGSQKRSVSETNTIPFLETVAGEAFLFGNVTMSAQARLPSTAQKRRPASLAQRGFN